uniref:Uncharacterized protein n=1 Tax=Arundo donax TaxID=35708 RepID=A0A0A9C3U3_ARUDO
MCMIIQYPCYQAQHQSTLGLIYILHSIKTRSSGSLKSC